MGNSQKIPYGYIYRAKNIQTGKIYIGQTTTSRWEEGRNAVEERWKEEVQEAYRKQNRGENLRYIENAIIKYGPENFKVIEQDLAYSQEELDKKETQHIQDYDSMNPDNGYNLKEGGLGGRLSEMAKENLSNVITEKYQTDSEYYNKQAEERRERAKDPEWVEKMTKINQERAGNSDWIKKITKTNQEIARNPETQEKMSKVLKKVWEDPVYQESVSKGVSNLWQKPNYRENQFRAKTEGKREIPDKAEFLKDIQEMSKKDINSKYEMDGKCINRRIKEMLGHRGVKNYSEAKKYLEDKNLDKVLNEINERQINQPESGTVKKVISNREDFLKDIQTMQKKEISQKYDMNDKTVSKRTQEMLGHRGVNNYTQAKAYLEDKNLDEVLKDINERLSNQSERYEGQSVISDKEQFLRDIQNMQKTEINYKYNLDGKTVNRRIEEILGEEGIRNYSQAREYLKDKNVDDLLNELQENESKELQDNEQLENESDNNKQEGKSEDENNLPEERSKQDGDETGEESQKEPKELKEPENEEKKEKTDEQPLDGTTKGVSEGSEGNLSMRLGKEIIEEFSKESHEIDQSFSDFVDNPLDAPLEESEDFNDVFDSPVGEKEEFNDVLDGPIEEKKDFDGVLDGSVKETSDLGGISKDIRRIDNNSGGTNDIPDDESVDGELGLSECPLGPGVPESARRFVGDEQDMLDLS